MGDGDGTRGKVEAGEGGEPAGDARPDGEGDLKVGGGARADGGRYYGWCVVDIGVSFLGPRVPFRLFDLKIFLCKRY